MIFDEMKLASAIKGAFEDMENWGELVHTEKWQAIDISQRPEAQMLEILHKRVTARLGGNLDLDYYREQIKPNLPWADDHFKERVCGFPLNPGTEWRNWPWSRSAMSHQKDEKFNHNYMERYWPKWAHLVKSPTTTSEEWSDDAHIASDNPKSPDIQMKGIKENYGDLTDVIHLLAGEPTTRQAYLPVWFPEDTGINNRGRKPCSLGYHFIMRNNRLDIRYDIRSCDMYRHFRDDIYLTIRLGLYVLEHCKIINPQDWINVVPGTFIMNITSLHMFINDYTHLFKHKPE